MDNVKHLLPRVEAIVVALDSMGNLPNMQEYVSAITGNEDARRTGLLINNVNKPGMIPV